MSRKQYYTFLRNAAGSADLNTDTPALFYVKVTKHTRINRVFFSLGDADIRYDQFLGMGVALSNGLQVAIWDGVDGSTLLDFCDGMPLKTTADFGILGGSDTIVNTTSTPGNDGAPLLWDVGSNQAIDLHKDQVFGIKVQDDLSSVSLFRVMLQG